MEIADRFVIDAPVDDVWELLRDPHVIAACFPGAELDEQVDPTTYAGRMVVKFGPTTVSFSGQATIEVDDAGRTGAIEARGRDGRGASAAMARAAVTVTGEGAGTAVAVDGTIDVSGPLSGFASTGGVHVARALFEDFAANVGARAKVTAADPAAPIESAAAPSAAKVAWRSLRSFLRGLFRRRRR